VDNFVEMLRLSAGYAAPQGPPRAVGGEDKDITGFKNNHIDSWPAFPAGLSR
jgi:hypothetical protein